MHIIQSANELREYESKCGLVSVYVDTRFQQEPGDTIRQIQRVFDENVGPAWTILIPVNERHQTRRGYCPHVGIDHDAYDIRMARQIAQDRGIPVSDLPALIFEFVPQREYYVLKIGDMNPIRFRNIVAHISEIAIEEFRDRTRSLEEFREAIHPRIFRFLFKEKVVHFVRGASPKLAALVGAVAGVKGIVT